MSLLLDKSFHSVAGFLDEIVSSPDVDEQMKSKAVKILLGFGLARGSFPNLLLVTDILLNKSPKFDLPLSEELKLLGNENPDLLLDTPSTSENILSNMKNSLEDIITTPEGEENKEQDKLKNNKKDFCSMATDGSYLYIHGKCGLVKIGSGFNGTVEGKLYIRQDSFRKDEKGWLCCVDNKLYYRSIEIAPKPFICLTTGDVEKQCFDEIELSSAPDEAFFITEQNPSSGSAVGGGVITTGGLSRTASESKENVTEFESKEEGAHSSGNGTVTTAGGNSNGNENDEDKIRLPNNRSPIITEGRYIYLISQWTREIDESNQRGARRGGGEDEEEEGGAQQGDGTGREEKQGEGEDDDEGIYHFLIIFMMNYYSNTF